MQIVFFNYSYTFDKAFNTHAMHHVIMSESHDYDDTDFEDDFEDDFEESDD